MRVRTVLSVAILTGVALSARTPVSIAETNVVQYDCMTSGPETHQTVKVSVMLTMPTDAVPNQQMSIAWTGSYVDGASLKVPAAGLVAGAKLYVHAGISGHPGLTSATSDGSELGQIGVGETIPLPESVTLHTTSQDAGTATVRPGAINVGATENSPQIHCDPQGKDSLKADTLNIGGAGTSTSPSATPTPAASAAESDEADETASPMPAGGVATGGGGEAGLDGRVLVLGGLLLAAAAGTGLLFRRRHSPL
ncbi:hypothetical protein J5X84_25025 [Streptosporangiaceae bacterium NEAU-GS5]|nr:hypothetical protein [Streptosporangiaceae bacterium NEAU-GS5]